MLHEGQVSAFRAARKRLSSPPTSLSVSAWAFFHSEAASARRACPVGVSLWVVWCYLIGV
jgi:hypothetical protein